MSNKSHRIFLENVRRRLEESLDELSELEEKIKIYVESILPDIISQFDGDPKLVLDNLVTKLQMYARDNNLDIEKVYMTFETLLKNNSIDGLGEIDDLQYAESMLTDADKLILERAVKKKLEQMLRESNKSKALDIEQSLLKDIHDTFDKSKSLDENVERELFEYSDNNPEVDGTLDKIFKKKYDTLADYFC